jgi:hypothetical protein
VVKYKGDGAHWFYGVPTRDMTDEEWAALLPEMQKAALASGLYEVEKPVEKPVKVKPAEAPRGGDGEG